MIPIRRRQILTVLFLAGCFSLTSCAGYRVGPVGKQQYKSAAVPMFRNQTLRPQLEAQVTNAVIKRLQADGSLRVESAPNADVVVTGNITRYQRSALRSLRDDTGVPREYRVSITAAVEVRDARTGQVLVKSTELTGSADTFLGEDQQSAEFQVWPLVADDLARQVVTLLAENW